MRKIWRTRDGFLSSVSVGAMVVVRLSRFIAIEARQRLLICCGRHQIDEAWAGAARIRGTFTKVGPASTPLLRAGRAILT